MSMLAAVEMGLGMVGLRGSTWARALRRPGAPQKVAAWPGDKELPLVVRADVAPRVLAAATLCGG